MKNQTLLGKTGSFHELLIESLRNSKKAEAYLKVAMDEYEKEGDAEIFLVAVRNVAEAKGGISGLAKRTHLSRQNLYHTLSSKGNPRLNTLGRILRALGYHLSIEHLHA